MDQVVDSLLPAGAELRQAALEPFVARVDVVVKPFDCAVMDDLRHATDVVGSPNQTVRDERVNGTTCHAATSPSLLERARLTVFPA